jgi:hypothetical protein
MSLETNIDVARSTTLRCIASYVLEITLFAAFRTRLRQGTCRESEPALCTFPIGQTAVWTDVTNESARSGESTMCADPSFFLLVHHHSLLVYLQRIRISMDFSMIIMNGKHCANVRSFSHKIHPPQGMRTWETFRELLPRCLSRRYQKGGASNSIKFIQLYLGCLSNRDSRGYEMHPGGPQRLLIR